MERYICGECGKEAIVEQDGVINRSCEHTGTVILDISVVCTGDGGMNG